MSVTNQKALDFIAEWKNKGDEKQDSQKFWFSLLKNVLNVSNPEKLLNFEQRVKLGHTSFIDVFIPQTKVIIEQKGKNIDLKRKYKQSDGSDLSPFEQAERYNQKLPHSQKARWIVTCNFQTFLIYDMENDPNGENPIELKLDELGTKYNELRFLSEYQDQRIIEEQKLSIKAVELIARIYDLLRPQYKDPDSENTMKSLNKLCVRLVFCLYAEDAGLFDRNDNHIFGNLLKKTETKYLRKTLIELFGVLDQDPEKNERDPYLDEELARFPYVNGNLFKMESPETDEIPNFTDELKRIIVEDCSESFDWADISPTIFGALFESTLNQETRRAGGMHFTSIENIHKVIDPLFLDDLKAEFDKIKGYKQEYKITKSCNEFQQKLASLKFLDPACGSGNFLTESYLCLRRLENELIRFKSKGSSTLAFVEDEFSPVKVSLSQFYGIEINDFAVAVANAALWIAESQMLHETETIIDKRIDFLPLKENSNIHCGNALRMDWEQVCSKSELSYIMGNPPFIGATMMNSEQKSDAVSIFGKIKLSHSIDYVGAWYYQAAKMIDKTSIRCALVSTNSITQGEIVSAMWAPLLKKYPFFHIDFAYNSFIWNSESLSKAHVHCVIIGFSNCISSSKKTLYLGNKIINVSNISPYLIDAENIIIESRSSPICSVPKMTLGNKPADGGNLILTPKEKEQVLNREPFLSKYIRPYVGAEEYINKKNRYCFWLKDLSPKDLAQSHELSERLARVKEMRLKSSAKPTVQKAETPHLFFFISQPKGNYLIVPSTSSENRKYIPIGFFGPDIIASNACTIVPNATLYHFGILTSSVHNAWMRVVAGRLKSDYRYSGNIVYNNFVWIDATDEQRKKISETAQSILDARSLYTDSSLSELYSEEGLLVATELRKAHKANDNAVLALYGLKENATEEEIVKELFKLYAEKIKELKE